MNKSFRVLPQSGRLQFRDWLQKKSDNKVVTVLTDDAEFALGYLLFETPRMVRIGTAFNDKFVGVFGSKPVWHIVEIDRRRIQKLQHRN